MRKIFIAVVSMLAGAFLCSAQSDFIPTTTWPYLYSDFTGGTAVLTGGSRQEALFNISLAGNKLHYIDKDLVKEIDSRDVMTVQIGSDIYQNVAGELLRVLAKSDKCLVVEQPEIDFATLNSTGAAYGSSSNTVGTMSLSSLEGIGGTNSNRNITHMELKNNKESGKALPLIKKNYIFAKGYKIYCTRKDFTEAPGIDRKAAAAFLKEHKIKWKDANSVVQAGDWLADNL